jgi:enoyl-CoA hydratase/carnithine racemase
LRRADPVFNDGYHALLNALQNLPKPVIAAINGDAMGGGFGLALACDIRIAARGDYPLGFPGVKVGLLLGGAGTQRLPHLLGVGRALDFILRGSVVDPDYALTMGLVHELAEDAAARTSIDRCRPPEGVTIRPSSADERLPVASPIGGGRGRSPLESAVAVPKIDKGGAVCRKAAITQCRPEINK